MKATLAVLRKELVTYFSSPLAYIILTAFLLLNGVIFYLILFFLNRPGTPPGAPLHAFFGGSFYYWLYILFIIPSLTMRLIAEERRSGTIELLMTTPVTETQVVAGKFLASMVFYTFLWAFSLVYVLIVHVHNPVELGPIFTGYLGILLHGMLFLSAGLFASVFTRNQVVAAIWAFVLLILLFSVGLLVNVASQQGWKDIFQYMTLWQQMDDFGKGIVDTRALVYCFSLTFLFLYLSVQTLAVRKWR